MAQRQLNHLTHGRLGACYLIPLSLSFCTCKMDMLVAFCPPRSVFEEDSMLHFLASTCCSASLSSLDLVLPDLIPTYADLSQFYALSPSFFIICFS